MMYRTPISADWLRRSEQSWLTKALLRFGYHTLLLILPLIQSPASHSELSPQNAITSLGRGTVCSGHIHLAFVVSIFASQDQNHGGQVRTRNIKHVAIQIHE